MLLLVTVNTASAQTTYPISQIVATTTPYNAVTTVSSNQNVYLPDGTATTSKFYVKDLFVSDLCTGCGSASSTLLSDANNWTGVNLFTNASSNFAGTWQTFSPSHFQVAGTYLTPTSLSGASVISYTSGTGVITTAPGTFGGSGLYTFPSVIAVGGSAGLASTTFSTGITVGTGYSPYPEYSFNADTNTGIDSSGPDIMNLVNGAINTMTLTSTNKVGIGTTSPAHKLSVQGNALISGDLTAANVVATGTLQVSASTTLQDMATGDSGYVSPYAYYTTGYGATTTAWTATSTASLTPAPFNGTIKTARCKTDAGTLNVDIYDGSTHLALINASTTVGTFKFTTNNTFTSNDVLSMVAGTPVSSPTTVSCTVGVLRTN